MDSLKEDEEEFITTLHKTLLQVIFNCLKWPCVFISCDQTISIPFISFRCKHHLSLRNNLCVCVRAKHVFTIFEWYHQIFSFCQIIWFLIL